MPAAKKVRKKAAKAKSKPKAKAKAKAKANTKARAKTSKPKIVAAVGSPFTKAFAKLLRSRKIPVPDGLLEAPPEAYAAQPASLVDSLAQLDNDALAERAGKIAFFSERQQERARQAWSSSPLIAELRRRGLKVPRAPKRPVGAAFSLKRPLAEWTDAELIEAAADWSRRGS